VLDIVKTKNCSFKSISQLQTVHSGLIHSHKSNQALCTSIEIRAMVSTWSKHHRLTGQYILIRFSILHKAIISLFLNVARMLPECSSEKRFLK